MSNHSFARHAPPSRLARPDIDPCSHVVELASRHGFYTQEVHELDGFSHSLQSTTKSMSAHHRDLSPPATMTLPQLPQTPQILVQSPFNQSPGQLTMYPQQMQGSEEFIRSWLTEKTEEDRERQEEETIQESLRLEQRKVEQDMFRPPLSGSIPPHTEKAVISVGELTTLLRDSSLNLTEPTQQVYRPKDELSLVDIILLDDADRKITPVLLNGKSPECSCKLNIVANHGDIC
jgi:hypothetical protein